MANENNLSRGLLPEDLLPEDLLPDNKDKDKKDNRKDNGQSHVHEFVGSTRIAGPRKLEHNHRFAGVTSEVIPLPGGGHIHAIFTNTDFTEDHLHELAVKTGPAIPVGNGRHIHFVEATTTLDAGHIHEAIFVTLIEDPTD